MTKKTRAERLYKRMLDYFRQQTDAGVPVELLGYRNDPLDGETLPTIEHRTRRKKPDFVEDELDGWEPLQ